MPVSITTSGIVASENTVVAATILTDSSTSLLNFVANIVVVAAVGADVAMVEVHLAIIDRRITVLEVHAALAQRFHLGAAQDHAGLKLLFDKIIVVGLPICGHHLILIVCIVRFGHVAEATAVSLARILI